MLITLGYFKFLKTAVNFSTFKTFKLAKMMRAPLSQNGSGEDLQ